MRKEHDVVRSRFPAAITFVAISAVLLVVTIRATLTFADGATLQLGAGEGSISITVDEYGSFGSGVADDCVGNCPGPGEAQFQPVGLAAAISTTQESGLAVTDRTAVSPHVRTFLTQGLIGVVESNGVPAAQQNGSFLTITSTSAQSTFSRDGMAYQLLQSVEPLVTSGNQTGAVLSQAYEITNTESLTRSIDLARYIDPDLVFDNSDITDVLNDGGGRLIIDGNEILYASDSPGSPSQGQVFLGINTAIVGAPSMSMFEVSELVVLPFFGDGLDERIIKGLALTDDIGGDIDDDGDVDNGGDVTMGQLVNGMLGPNETFTLVTRTVFGSGSIDGFDGFPGGGGVPEPATVAMLSLAGTALLQRRRHAQ